MGACRLVASIYIHAFELALTRMKTALERSVYATKSFLAGFALVKAHLSVDDLANVAQVEVLSQIETWGEVEDCKYCRLSPQNAFLNLFCSA